MDPFSEKKSFLNDIFQDGEGTEFKANPDAVANATRRGNERLFQISEFLTTQQVPLYFSTKKVRHTSTLLHLCQVPASFQNRGKPLKIEY